MARPVASLMDFLAERVVLDQQTAEASDGQVFQIHKVSDGVYKDHILENEACQCSMDGPDGPKDLFELKLIGRENIIPDECSSGTPGQTPLSPFVSERFSIWKEILEKVLDVQYPGLMGDLGIEYGEDDGSGIDRKLDVEKVDITGGSPEVWDSSLVFSFAANKSTDTSLSCAGYWTQQEGGEDASVISFPSPPYYQNGFPFWSLFGLPSHGMTLGLSLKWQVTTGSALQQPSRLPSKFSANPLICELLQESGRYQRPSYWR
ncbi:hypothetical protein TrRE_jg1418 [Triparma retinervis]|uniref:Uncharacterized protein n=1 Tax=Triparma retinervis TaxID=2557542 RepID=A0A9W7DLB2_9STRA|nr:hypothetical protein TrRE_jg1418 [Triparma retinervis]